MPPVLSSAIPNLFRCLFVTVITEGKRHGFNWKVAENTYVPALAHLVQMGKHALKPVATDIQSGDQPADQALFWPRATDSVSGDDHDFTSGICGRRANKPSQFNE